MDVTCVSAYRWPDPSLSSIAAPDSIPCCIEAPEDYVPKARYALGVLLGPLGLVPRWVERSGLSDGGLYYGSKPDGLPDVLAIRLDADTPQYFASGETYDAADVSHLDWDGERWPVLFPRTETASGPDVIAAAFFWLSGWQEVTVTVRDEHGRFPYDASLQAVLGCIDQPLVDVYRRWLAEALIAQGVPVRQPSWQGQPWAVAMTHDVDLLRKRRLGTVVRAIPRRDGRRVAALRQAAFAPDPRRRSIARMAEAERVRGAGATYFFKTAARGPWDVPYDHDSPYLRALIADLETTFEIGLHPSYFAHDHAVHLREERDRLNALTTVRPTTIRQHFLRFDPVVTPRLHQATGFEVDSTLGFSRREGFRRGTCFPFPLFDVPANRPFGVWELPLAVMDTTLFTHRGLGKKAATAVVDGLFAMCRRMGGCCVVLWHNTSYDEVDYPGSAEVFEHALDAAFAGGAAVLSARDAVVEGRYAAEG